MTKSRDISDMDFNKPYGRVRGKMEREGIAYSQDYNFYDCKGKFVKEASNKPKRPKAPVPKQSPRARKPKEARGPKPVPQTEQERLLAELGSFNTIPKSVQDARRENRAAESAEALTDG